MYCNDAKPVATLNYDWRQEIPLNTENAVKEYF